VEDILTAIDESVEHGFVAERYHRSTIEKLYRSENKDIELELLLTDAFLGQTLHRGRGTVSPSDLDPEWQLPSAEVDAAALLLDSIKKNGAVQTVQITGGPALKSGQSNDRIVALNQLLLGPGNHSSLFDEDMRLEVEAYQRAAGLEPDGIVGEGTLEALNETNFSFIDKIDANLERWRWLPRQSPDVYLRVNIAAYRLRVIANGETTLAMNVIVGKPFRRTPVFTETIKYFVLNPSWNVPYNIATKDKLPLLQSVSAAEAEKGFEVKPNGSDVFIPVDTVDWRTVTHSNFN
jgi:murein L,D-transpeptidase YcbB/YkuD